MDALIVSLLTPEGFFEWRVRGQDSRDWWISEAMKYDIPQSGADFVASAMNGFAIDKNRTTRQS